ncbi:selenocysteine-specific translation elongation factor [Rhodococcus antarcticus]|uniref:Selenocysteine-specific translation elongation factor n=1 Tax=Rhodococcus antarcticus TaxID=2987751 RepID=A0ABY6P286_9NOCA|nr:selenocysteine-specific translation elongation factor [Rhodococcus antarcticus]UZJ25765.1 selenocysteine-specific translation elongation factor [Rhodococcus antarcticus]
MHVLATAGHVDHGKSTLVRALTGMEPDRWAEERRRGMTLDLGFAWTALGSGQTVAFVDVPGHERFVPTMLAGVGPVPAALMVVAADEGWMPQSAEHLDALDALGVTHGLLVVTRSDLLDPELALTDAQEHLSGTGLANVAAVAVSATTGEGMAGLRTALGVLVDGLPAPDTTADVRLWVDRAFTVRGAGTVVTGTLAAGTLRVGDELELAGRRVGVRGLQSLGAATAEVASVARVAVNVRGVGVDDVPRGTALLSPGRWRSTGTLDVRVRPVRGAELDLPTHGVLHVGAAAVPARIRPLGIDTARLTLDHPLPLRIGDRAVLRDSGARRVVGGVVVLDPAPPSLRRRGAAVDRATVLSRMDGRPDGAAELARRGTVRAEDLRALGAPVPADAPNEAGWLVDPALLDPWRARLAAAVRAHARLHPLDPGLPVEAARRALDLPDARLLALVSRGFTVREGRVHAAGTTVGLPPAVEQAVTTLLAELGREPFAAPDAPRLAALHLGPRELAAAGRAGLLLKVVDGVWLAPDALTRAVAVLAGLDQPFTPAAAREAMHSSRRVVVPLLELLAARGLTVRDEDGTHSVA